MVMVSIATPLGLTLHRPDVDMRVHDGYQAARRVRHGDVGRPNTLRSSIFARSSRRLSDEDSDRPVRLMYRLSIDMADWPTEISCGPSSGGYALPTA
jgi:hypothetical protein